MTPQTSSSAYKSPAFSALLVIIAYMTEYGTNYEGLIDRHHIALSKIYDEAELSAFKLRLEEFIGSDPSLPQILSLEGDELVYDSESFVPPISDPTKKSVVLVLGNPAPESVAMQAMFAYENHGKRYHRFWRVLDETGILQFSENPDTIDPHEKMLRLYRGDYSSPFNVSIVPFYSLPTPPGGKWGGVAGLQRLFGNAFKRIEAYDLERVEQFFAARLEGGDTVVVFQKDAYLAILQSPEEQVYDYRRLLQEPTVSTINTSGGAELNLVCMLPTRLLHSHQTKDALKKLSAPD